MSPKMPQVFSDSELQTLAAALHRTAKLYETGGTLPDSTDFFGNRTHFKYLPEVVRDIPFAQEVYRRDAQLGLNLMMLCDTLVMLASSEPISAKHLKALSSRHALDALDKHYDKISGNSNPLKCSGLFQLMEGAVQLRLKDALKDAEETRRLLTAINAT